MEEKEIKTSIDVEENKKIVDSNYENHNSTKINEDDKMKKSEINKEEVFALSSHKLLVSGSHFGHKTRQWNPKMAKFIYNKKRNIHIINLKKTIKAFQNAYNFVKTLGENNKPIIFVGTKKQAKSIIKREALRCKSMFVAERWLGGTLTNFRTIKKRFHRLSQIEKMEEDGVFSNLPKKEVILLKKEYNKLLTNLEGIRNMRGMPSAIFVIDPIIEINAIREANKLKIPIISIVDTNCDPSVVTFPIPGNDDAVKSISLFTTAIADAYNEGKGLKPEVAYTKDEIKEYENKNNSYRDRKYRNYGDRKNYDDRKFKSYDKKKSWNYDDKKTRNYSESKDVKILKNDSKESDGKQWNKKDSFTPPSNEQKETNLEKKEIKLEPVKTNKNDDYKKMTLIDLKKIAKNNDVKNYSKLKKDELIELLNKEVNK